MQYAYYNIVFVCDSTHCFSRIIFPHRGGEMSYPSVGKCPGHIEVHTGKFQYGEMFIQVKMSDTRRRQSVEATDLFPTHRDPTRKTTNN